MKIFFIISLLSILLFSCAEINYQQILQSQETELKSKGGYESYLALEYLSFSRKLKEVNDIESSQYFAKKGLDIASGKQFIPENPLKWKADPIKIQELIFSQKKLELLLNNQTLIFQMPIQMAHLSYLYDCWSSKESKQIFSADELSYCRVSFSKLVDEIEIYLDELNKDRSPLVKITTPEFFHFEILFDKDSYVLNDKATKSMTEVIDFILSLQGRIKIFIAVNIDKNNNQNINYSLIKNRVAIIKNYLVKNGIDQSVIQEKIENEDFPDIITNDEISNHIDRTVGIYILKGNFGGDLDGNNDFKPYPLPLLQNILYKNQVESARQERDLKN